MIQPGEIQQLAQKARVRDTQIEKDYVITWVLKGLSQHPMLSEQLIFKGGTVLKKAYFQNYRFSEDLDFTLLSDATSNEEIYEAFRDVFTAIRREANIPLEIDEQNEHQSGSINCYISYTGPLGGVGKNKRLKTDITRGEQLEFDPEIRPIFLTYSDVSSFSMACYPLNEVLIEKMCALMGRSQPRDLYDLWYLLEIHGMDIAFYKPEFENKALHKELDPESFLVVLERKMELFQTRWEGSMAAQIHELPDFDTVTRELGRHMRNFVS